jgi:predicted MFS family arabinose efflux permease
MSAATATGQLIFLTPAAWLAEHYGWRAALLPTIAMIALLALAFVLLSRDRPSDLGLPPYGEDAVLPPPIPSVSNPFLISLRTFGMASQTLVFWVLAFTFFVCGVSSFGLVPHFVTMCGDVGITPVVSTSLLTMIGICDLIGTIGSGWLSDRYDNRWLLAFYYDFRGLSLMWLPYSGFSLIGLSGFAVFYGLDFIATVPPTVKLAVRAFGRDQAPVVFGWIFAAHQMGSGLMALGAGESRDAFNTYMPAFFTAGVVCILAAASLLLLRGRTGPVVPAAPTVQPA